MPKSNMRPTKVYIRCTAGEGNNWTVSLNVVDAEDGEVLHESPTFCLKDPWTVDEYRKHLNPLRQPDADADRAALKDYGKKLVNQLDLRRVLAHHLCERLYVFEDFSSQRNTKIPSIHSLLWEVLEHRDIWPCLESTPVALRGPRIIRVVLREAKEPVQSLESGGGRRSCRILLVLARDLQVFSRSDCKRKEASPGLIQNVLTNIAKFLDSKGASSYLTLHVVRPGTFEQLGRFLSANTYDIVHFDLHGHVSERVAKLRFAVQPANDDPGKDPALDENHVYDDQNIEKVADLLQKHRVSNVALNSCKSAYALQSPTTNMAHTLIDRGVVSVCAMSYDIYEDAAGPYYKAFYEAFILEQKSFHDAASSARHKLRQRFEKQIECEPSGRTQKEFEYLIPVSYRNRTQTLKDEFNWHHNPAQDRFCLPFAVTLLVLVGVALLIRVDLLQKSEWLWSWVSQALRLLWALFQMYIFWSVHTGSEHGVDLARIPEYMRNVKYYAAAHILSRTDLPTQYRHFRKAQKQQLGGASDFKFCLGHMDLEEKLHRHRYLYVYHSHASKRQLRALVRIWIQTGFIDSAIFKDANRFFDLWHRLCWSWTATQNIDHFVTKLRDEIEAENPEWRGRSITLDGEVVKDMDDWISCQGSEGSYILLTGSSRNNRYWWLNLRWGGQMKNRWKAVQPYELRE
ncbi:hypothetical protein F5883DRAFT_616815 [Diaporthe sp. PMI_573]|nr:hypothetical protein F5883DRAFT_616815 [Diaporthaceae sp. PMI_573]